jgi:hypothetical protein
MVPLCLNAINQPARSADIGIIIFPMVAGSLGSHLDANGNMAGTLNRRRFAWYILPDSELIRR